MARATRSGSRLDAALLFSSGALAVVALLLPPNTRDGFAAGVRRTVMAPAVAIEKRAVLARTAFETHDAVAARDDSIAMRALRVTALESENAHFRRLLGLGRALQWGFVPAEALRGATHEDDFSVTLTAGSRAGVKVFSPVVSAEGLVGMVYSVDPQSSLAIEWGHPDFRVSAMSSDGSTFGIAQAHLGSGADRYLLELRGVPFRTPLKPGSIIVSSGLGGVYPRGIPIGTVLGEVKTAEGWARTYLLRPMVPPSEVTSVMILEPQRAASGVESVWASAIAADSAARAIAEAADSIAKTDSSATRRAADSLRADSALHARAIADSLNRVMLHRDTARRLPVDTLPRRRRRADSTRVDSARVAPPPAGNTTGVVRPVPVPVPVPVTPRRDTTRRPADSTVRP